MYLSLGNTIFHFFVTVMTVMATLAPDSCRWGSGDGRATETSTVEDPRLGDARAS
jgi:hypothetical protein